MAFSGKIGVFGRFSGFFGVLMQSFLANSKFFWHFPAKSTIFRRFWHLNAMYNYCKQQVRCQGGIFCQNRHFKGVFQQNLRFLAIFWLFWCFNAKFSGKLNVFWRFPAKSTIFRRFWHLNAMYN